MQTLVMKWIDGRGVLHTSEGLEVHDEDFRKPGGETDHGAATSDLMDRGKAVLAGWTPQQDINPVERGQQEAARDAMPPETKPGA